MKLTQRAMEGFEGHAHRPLPWRGSCGASDPCCGDACIAAACCALCCRKSCATADRSSVMRRCRRAGRGGHDGCARPPAASSMAAAIQTNVVYVLMRALSPGWGEQIISQRAASATAARR
jgi:hypothetical protein